MFRLPFAELPVEPSILQRGQGTGEWLSRAAAPSPFLPVISAPSDGSSCPASGAEEAAFSAGAAVPCQPGWVLSLGDPLGTCKMDGNGQKQYIHMLSNMSIFLFLSIPYQILKTCCQPPFPTVCCSRMGLLSVTWLDMGPSRDRQLPVLLRSHRDHWVPSEIKAEASSTA